MNRRPGILLAGSALALGMLGAWVASRPQPPASARPDQAEARPAAVERLRPSASEAPAQAAVLPGQQAMASAPAASVGSRSLGDRLAAGVEALPPEEALMVARLLRRCVNLPMDFQLLDMRLGREEAGASKTKMLREREALMALERNCQTLPAEVRTWGDEFQLRSRLLRHAYAAHEPGAAADLLSMPKQFAGVPASELKERVLQDARAGDLPTLSAWVLLNAQTDELETPEMKVLAFALQRAARLPELKEAVAQTQAVYTQVLEEYWAKRHPEAHSARPVGFNTDAHGAFLYPQGFDEPTDAAYLAQAQAMDAALIRAWRRRGKPA